MTTSPSHSPMSQTSPPGLYNFGEISIVDLNSDDQFDTNTDRVTGSDGEALEPQVISQKLRGILKQLGLPRWNGILLSKASDYLAHMDLAKYQSGQGEVEITREALEEASQSATISGIPWKERQAKQILITVLRQSVDLKIQEAERLAQQGSNVDETLQVLQDAVQTLEEHNKISPLKKKLDQKKIEGILTDTYLKGIPNLYVEAKKNALKGNVGWTGELLAGINYHVRQANRFFYSLGRSDLILSYDRTQAQTIMELAYLQGIPKAWGDARFASWKKDVPSTQFYLTCIQVLVDEANYAPFHLGLNFDQNKALVLLKRAAEPGS